MAAQSELGRGRAVPDHETLRALYGLEPLLSYVYDLLHSAEVPGDVFDDLLAAVGEAYAMGRIDGVRSAVAQVATEAEKRGLRLMLAPDLEAGGAA
jgi:hypothetical protein